MMWRSQVIAFCTITALLTTASLVNAQGGFTRNDDYDCHAYHTAHFSGNSIYNIKPIIATASDFRLFKLRARPERGLGQIAGSGKSILTSTTMASTKPPAAMSMSRRQVHTYFLNRPMA
jgi:hypothetical protein